MSDIDRQIRARTEAFVSDLSKLVRQSALAAVAQILGGDAGRGSARGSGRAPAAVKPSASAKAKSGQKRPPDEIKKTTERVLAYVNANPGQGVEAMGKGLNLSTREVTLPIKKLLKLGLISAAGQKRATKYSPADGKAPARRGGRRGKKK